MICNKYMLAKFASHHLIIITKPLSRAWTIPGSLAQSEHIPGIPHWNQEYICYRETLSHMAGSFMTEYLELHGSLYTDL